MWSLFYLLVALAAFGLGTALAYAARAAGLHWGIMDKPAGRKAHARPIAVTGGWGIFLTFMGMVLGGVLFSDLLAAHLPPSLGQLAHYLKNIDGVRGKIFAVVGGTIWMFFIGALDDLKPLGPKVKLAAQVLGTIPLLAAGIAIKGFLPDPLGWVLTIGWVILLTNSFNLLDNMDGLSASVALAICLVLSLAAVQAGERWLPALFLSLAGALGGFLVFNFHPASMFMGDAGALTVGYLMGVFSILITYYTRGVPSGLPVLMPLAIMGVPLFDTLSVMWIRWRAGKPLMLGDRNHFSHRLQAMGFGVRQTAVTIAVLAAAIGLAALPLRYLNRPAAFIHLLALVCFFGVIGALEFVGRRNR